MNREGAILSVDVLGEDWGEDSSAQQSEYCYKICASGQRQQYTIYF